MMEVLDSCDEMASEAKREQKATSDKLEAAQAAAYEQLQELQRATEEKRELKAAVERHSGLLQDAEARVEEANRLGGAVFQ